MGDVNESGAQESAGRSHPEGAPVAGDWSTERALDLDSLKGLAHPLRVRILDALSTYGSSTASGLAERLGESSGATSYHLRQLEKHGFVREVAGKGTSRERWWERVPGAINLSPKGVIDSPVGRDASRIVMRQWKQNRDRLLDAFIEQGPELLSDEWMDASVVSTANTRLTQHQLGELTKAWEALFHEYIEKYKGQEVPGSRPVQVHFNAFPVLDGEEIPDDPNVSGSP